MSNKEEIERFIELIESTADRENLGFEFNEGSDPHFYFTIKANSEGLKLYASKLLEVALRFEEKESKGETEVFFEPESDWIKGVMSLEYIEMYTKEGGVAPTKLSFKERVEGFIWGVGCAAIALFLIAALIVGIYTIFNS